jgi:hypothetical protein
MSTIIVNYSIEQGTRQTKTMLTQILDYNEKNVPKVRFELGLKVWYYKSQDFLF